MSVTLERSVRRTHVAENYVVAEVIKEASM